MRLCIEAVGAGLCAALASVFAKLALTSHKVPELCQSFIQATLYSGSTGSSIRPEDLCMTVTSGLRVICFSLIFVLNAIMWTLFVKSLQRTSSIVATTTNTASNFFFTAASGWMIFGESLPLAWFFGAILIVAGLVLINCDGLVVSDDAKHKTL